MFSLHRDQAFRQLAEASRIDRLIRNYEDKGVGFCFYDSRECPVLPGTGYNLDPVRFEGRKAGTVFIDSVGLDGFDMLRQDAFAAQVLHELGHHEAFSGGLNHACERLAWLLAGEIASTVYPRAARMVA
jgi:hypothetical protein